MHYHLEFENLSIINMLPKRYISVEKTKAPKQRLTCRGNKIFIKWWLGGQMQRGWLQSKGSSHSCVPPARYYPPSLAPKHPKSLSITPTRFCLSAFSCQASEWKKGKWNLRKHNHVQILNKASGKWNDHSSGVCLSLQVFFYNENENAGQWSVHIKS